MGERGELNLGPARARALWDKKRCSIGFTTHSGTVTAASDWDAPAERKRVRPAYPESYEVLFHQVGTRASGWNLSKHSGSRPHLRGARLERAIGVIYRPETELASHYFHGPAARPVRRGASLRSHPRGRTAGAQRRMGTGRSGRDVPERPLRRRSSGTDDLFAAAPDSALGSLGTTAAGLTNEQASERLSRFGANQLRARKHATGLVLLLRQFTSPIILILIGAAVLSIFLRDVTDAAIILTIVLVSGLLGFWQERGAATAVAKLLAYRRHQSARAP